jgi:hypothetical protein
MFSRGRRFPVANADLRMLFAVSSFRFFDPKTAQMNSSRLVRLLAAHSLAQTAFACTCKCRRNGGAQVNHDSSTHCRTRLLYSRRSSRYSLAASAFAGEFGLGSHSND